MEEFDNNFDEDIAINRVIETESDNEENEELNRLETAMDLE